MIDDIQESFSPSSKRKGELVAPGHLFGAVVFGFDGSVLSICCEGKLIALAGQGPPWTIRFKVAASALRRVPKRLMEERVGLSIWQSHLSLGRWLYEGSPEGFSSSDPSRIQ